MIHYLEGDIFNSPALFIVNTVNTMGVMGKGLALQFKTRYPNMFLHYQQMCEKRKFQMGKLMICQEVDHNILLFPTKENWRNPSKLEYIETGLMKFTQHYVEKNITSIAFPKLGCGNGELDWKDVQPLMEKYLARLPIDIYIYLGTIDNQIPEHKQPKEIQKWLRENAKDMSFNGLVDDIKHQSSMLPYTFNIENKQVNVRYNNGLLFEFESENIKIEENDFFKIWDEIRNKDIFIRSSDKNKFLISEMLLSLGYLSRVKIKNNDTNNMEMGYQLNEGLERAFIINGGMIK